jgi:hypothetical protein
MSVGSGGFTTTFWASWSVLANALIDETDRSGEGVLQWAAVAYQPGGGAGAPGHRPECAGVGGHVWGDVGVVGFVGGVGYDVLDDAIEEPASLAGRP